MNEVYIKGPRQVSYSVLKMEGKIQKLFTSKKASCAYAGASTFKKSKEAKQFSNAQIDKGLIQIPAYAYHRPCVRKFKRRFVSVPTINHQFGADLIEIKYPRSNYNKKYILGVVDHFSRSAWLEALKSKSADDVLVAFKKIFKRTKRQCRYMTFDEGREFLNRKVLGYFKEKGIKHFVTSSSTKCCINERFNRTIGQRIARYLTDAKSKRFVHMLPIFERQYNNSYHRTIKCAPNEVTEENAPEIWENIYSSKLRQLALERSKETLKIGDSVLIPIKKTIFTKGYDRNWGSDIFTISEIKRTRPVTYLLKDKDGDEIKGGWYRNELLKVT